MKEPELKDWACRLLEDQLMRLAELRNANPRDPGFKLWRQTTLTVIQRVWPGNLPRSERFRRVPFTPSTARPTRVQVREHFERGCAEATGYLRELISEIQNGALDPNRPAEPAAPATLPTPATISAALAAPLPGEAEPSAPPSEPEPIQPLPGEVEPSAPPPPIPGFQSSTLSAATDVAPRSPAPGQSVRPPRKSGRALKEMLGFVDEAPASEPLEEESLEPERPSASFGQPAPAATPLPLEPEPEPLPLEPEPLPLVEESAIQPLAEASPRSIPAEEVERLDADEPLPAEEPAVPRAVAQSSTPAPVAVPVKSAPRSPVATALQALAGEVAELGVPEGKRAAARAALTDLARQIEERTADWETLRDAFALAMDYPPLARRVVPLLVPFLDLE